jgi:hypothetical protein
VKKRNRIQKHILQKLAFWARAERRFRGWVDLESRRRGIASIHAARHEFLTETIPALYGKI